MNLPPSIGYPSQLRPRAEKAPVAIPGVSYERWAATQRLGIAGSPCRRSHPRLVSAIPYPRPCACACQVSLSANTCRPGKTGVPRSTAVGWLRSEPRKVVSADLLDMDQIRLQAEVLKLRQRNRRLCAVIRLLLALARPVGAHLEHVRRPVGAARVRVLRGIGCAERVLSLWGARRVLRLSPCRYHQWREAQRYCGLSDEARCPRSTPTRLTADEVLEIKAMVTSREYRHVSTGRLALLAQRLGRVLAAPATS